MDRSVSIFPRRRRSWNNEPIDNLANTLTPLPTFFSFTFFLWSCWIKCGWSESADATGRAGASEQQPSRGHGTYTRICKVFFLPFLKTAEARPGWSVPVPGHQPTGRQAKQVLNIAGPWGSRRHGTAWSCAKIQKRKPSGLWNMAVLCLW